MFYVSLIITAKQKAYSRYINNKRRNVSNMTTENHQITKENSKKRRKE